MVTLVISKFEFFFLSWNQKNQNKVFVCIISSFVFCLFVFFTSIIDRYTNKQNRTNEENHQNIKFPSSSSTTTTFEFPIFWLVSQMKWWNVFLFFWTMIHFLKNIMEQQQTHYACVNNLFFQLIYVFILLFLH